MELKLGEGVVGLHMSKGSGGSNFVGKIHLDRTVLGFVSLQDFKITGSSACRQGFLLTSFFGGVVVSSLPPRNLLIKLMARQLQTRGSSDHPHSGGGVLPGSQDDLLGVGCS